MSDTYTVLALVNHWPRSVQNDQYPTDEIKIINSGYVVLVKNQILRIKFKKDMRKTVMRVDMLSPLSSSS